MNRYLVIGPILLVIGLAILCTGCVFQPIHVEVYIPTSAVVQDSAIELDAHKEILNVQ